MEVANEFLRLGYQCVRYECEWIDGHFKRLNAGWCLLGYIERTVELYMRSDTIQASLPWYILGCKGTYLVTNAHRAALTDLITEQERHLERLRAEYPEEQASLAAYLAAQEQPCSCRRAPSFCRMFALLKLSPRQHELLAMQKEIDSITHLRDSFKAMNEPQRFQGAVRERRRVGDFLKPER